jgi:uncharacterized protein (TIGR02246 family)
MSQTFEEQLRALETTYWNAIQQKDEQTAMKLSDERCVVVGAQGVGELDRERLGQMLKQATYELTRYQFDDKKIQVRKLTDDVAVIAYEVREDLIVDGKEESLIAFDASVWVKRGDQWLCALHTESLRGDPFGRMNRKFPEPTD